LTGSAPGHRPYTHRGCSHARSRASSWGKVWELVAQVPEWCYPVRTRHHRRAQRRGWLHGVGVGGQDKARIIRAAVSIGVRTWSSSVLPYPFKGLVVGGGPQSDVSMSAQGPVVLAQCGDVRTVMESDVQRPRLCQPHGVGVIRLLTLVSRNRSGHLMPLSGGADERDATGRGKPRAGRKFGIRSRGSCPSSVAELHSRGAETLVQGGTSLEGVEVEMGHASKRL
jgi:hypothetical protein